MSDEAKQPHDLLVAPCISTFNEKRTIGGIVVRALRYVDGVIGCGDGSGDLMVDSLYIGDLVYNWGFRLWMEIRGVDSQGRISLPVEWRREVLADGDEVYVFREGESLIVRARRESDLSEHFDSVPVDVDPEAFKDYHKLKKALLKGV